MKNVRPNQLKKCIYLYFEDFKEILHEIFGNSISVDYCESSCDGGYISVYYDNEDTSEVSFDDLSAALANYFDVARIESIHVDYAEYIGVWIVYAEKNAGN